jgi:hypothetical protein
VANYIEPMIGGGKNWKRRSGSYGAVGEVGSVVEYRRVWTTADRWLEILKNSTKAR